LAAVTRAKPKIANYPFTTVIPNLGVWIPGGALEEAQSSQSDKGAGSEGLVLCDVPGLIAGAAQGVGLGHAFLRHVERCHVILHLIDATSNDPAADYEMLNREIVKYGTGQLAQMPQVVVINKIDAFEGAKQEWEEGLEVKWARNDLERKMKESMPHSRLMWMSAREREGVDDLMSRLASFVKKVKAGVP
jgi:GTP-binding protein